MTETARARYLDILVLVSWLTALWALVSLYFFHAGTALPHFFEFAVMGSAAASFVGGCLGLLYLASRARSTTTVVSGSAAALFNLVYVYTFVRSL
jgi:hypothetical protein